MNLVMLAALLCVCAAGATAQFVELVVDRDAFAHVAAELASEVEEAAQAEQDACWKHVEWRGLGKFGKNGTCADNEEKEMGLWYVRSVSFLPSLASSSDKLTIPVTPVRLLSFAAES